MEAGKKINPSVALTQDSTATDATVSPEEKQLLDNAGEGVDTAALRHASLDIKDADGDLLNERTAGNDVSGADLDVPGAELDDEQELLGEEDEENNAYSVGGDDNE